MNKDDYLLKIKILNNRIVKLMRQINIDSVFELSCKANINQTLLYELINMKISPFRYQSSDWRPCVLKLADFFGVLPEEMFNYQQLNEPLTTNKSERSIGLEGILNILNHKDDQLLPDANLEIEERNKLLYESLKGLTHREEKILRLRFDIDGDGEYTLEDIAKKFDVSRERIRQIELKALRKLNNRHRELKQLLN